MPDCPALPHLEDDEARFLCKIIYTDHTRYHRSPIHSVRPTQRGHGTTFSVEFLDLRLARS